MRQSTIIFGTLLGGFVIYITLRGQLPDYLALFTSSPSGGNAGLDKVDNTDKNNENGTKSKPATSPYNLDTIFKNMGLDGKGGYI